MGKKRKIELMAPVGDFCMLNTACREGADAVYFGLKSFSMRSGNKKHFLLSDLKKIRETANSYPQKTKIYLTLNSILFDNELIEIKKIIKKASGLVDAIICSDFAVIDLCKRYKVPFIISTQLSVSNKKALIYYKKLGAKRVVLARELSLNQIREISKVRGIEKEVFIHGAMCVAVSGRCFTSQFLFNRSANRGECLHPCRRKYIIEDEELGYKLRLERGTVMSAKDLCVLPFMEEVKKLGISAVKIEGRNRDSRYIEKTVRIYRDAIDNRLSKDKIKKYMEELEDVYNRGFSSGFYLGKPLPEDFAEFENSASRTYREFVGEVVYFYPKIKVALLRLRGRVERGDEIAVFGEKSGVEHLTIKEMEKDKKRVSKAKKGEEVGIKVDFKPKIGDSVYKIKKRKIGEVK